ncbi:sce7726 family protein [Paenibacillus sp. FSL R7-0198]|uniref:sce7726 family protein n=1 Tax=unclassified Paenibacillus TaxID=185978 RepID=UPI0030CF2F7C
MSSLSDLARIYSASFIRQIISSGYQPLLDELSKSFEFVKEANINGDFRLLFDEAYSILLKHYRCEYIYKSELYGKMKKESRKKMKNGILTEVKSGSCVADLLWLNGTSIAYEIKTEIDNNRRLANQINSYQQLFKQTMVVSYEKNIELILSQVPNHVGIMFLSKRGALKVYREAGEYTNELNPGSMFLTLRRHEYEAVIKEAYGDVPRVSDAFIFEECLKLFKELEPLDAHDLMVKQLKLRAQAKIDNSFVWPKSIRFLLERGSLKRSEVLQFRRIIH